MEVVQTAVKMLPSQEEPVMDPGGLWYAGREGMMIVVTVEGDKVVKMNLDTPEVVVEWILGMMKMAVRTQPSQEAPIMDTEGL